MIDMMKNIWIVLLVMVFNSCSQDQLLNDLSKCTPFTTLTALHYDSLKNDPIHVETIEIVDNCLRVKVSYSGCTTDHPVQLVQFLPLCLTPPEQAPYFEIRHDSRNEFCKMLVCNELYFDLSPLKNTNHKKVRFTVSWPVDMENWESKELEYNF
jgi:hypothetical protein